MGMTPLEGLVMGTRSGDIDPAVLLHLQRRAGLDADGLDDAAQQAQRPPRARRARRHARPRAGGRAGDDAATLAFDVYAHRLRSYVGAYAAQLGRVDVIVFTAGVGENSPACGRGRSPDSRGSASRSTPSATASGGAARRISTDASEIAVLVVPTNEELEIARQTLEVVGA